MYVGEWYLEAFMNDLTRRGNGGYDEAICIVF